MRELCSRSASSSLILILTVMVIGFVPVRAHADAADDVYSDVKKVVEELVTKEVAENVVPAVACTAPKLARFYPKTLTALYSRRFGSIKGTLRDETSEAVAYRVYQAMLAPTKKYLEVDASFSTEKGLVACKEKTKKQFAEKRFPDPTDPQMPGTYGKPVSLDELCREPADGQKEVACQLARASRSLLLGRPSDAENQLVQVAAFVVTNVIINRAPSFVTGNLAEDVSISELRLRLAERVVLALHAASKPEFTDSFADTIIKLMAEVVLQGQTLPDKFDRAAFEKALKDELGTAVVALDRLPFQWQASVVSDNLDFKTFLEVIAGSRGALKELCGQEVSCTNLTTAFSQTSELADLVDNVARQDFSALASQVIRPLFRKCANDDKDGDECAKTSVYERFIESLATYTLEASTQGEASTSTHAAFTSTAIDLLNALGERGGSGFDRQPLSKLIMPELALRYGWSGSYFNNDGKDGSRFYVTVDWLVIRKRLSYQEYNYVAVQLSLVDVVGPLSELALRANPEDGYLNGALVLLDVLHPRFEVLYGVPAFSRRLALSANVGLRMATPVRESDGTFTYTSVFSNETKRKSAEYSGQFFELGFALKYLL